MKLKFISLTFICLLVFGSLSSVFAQATPKMADHYEILSQNAREMVISFDFKKLNIGDGSDKLPQLKVFQIDGLNYNYIDGLPLLPVLSLPISLPDEKFTAIISQVETESYPGFYPQTFYDERTTPIGAKNASDRGLPVATPQKTYTDVFPQNIFYIQKSGQFRDYIISNLQIYPVKVDGSGVRFYKKFTLKITFAKPVGAAKNISVKETDLLKKFVANKGQVNYATPQTAPLTQLPISGKNGLGSINHDQRLRLVVLEDGIYQVSGQDLEDEGIDIATIDPRSLRITNKGNEVALFVEGEEDNILDREDYLEFWGEKNTQTFIREYPDLYSDPFSDENVYWLEWGGENGLRMVEESGSIVTTRPGQFNPSLLYTTTVHIERNRHFERFGRANLEQLSFKRDNWFFDAGISAVGKRSYPFQLIHPEESAIQKVFVKVMLAGQSFGTHDVMVWLNNSFVGESRQSWYSQDTVSISNFKNSSIFNNKLAHGENILEIQLPRLNAGGGTDKVLLNWFDITYSRKYRAFENEIDFIRPSFIPYPYTDLFQFDIDGFSNPDIEIYKKDVSKIINYRIDAEAVGDSISYKIAFQDEVPSDNIEYIAITPDKKKKPLRIERDQPFDLAAPERFLKDANNAAEYIVITHKRFYDNVLAYRDYRASQGVAIEVVNVQDIYDEFNHGIKSPLAIQDFLKYAFFNWQRSPRLEYVLLFGDATFDYKSTNPLTQDLVPTFFYQTQQFGAAASDFPYALIAGDDQIPDLFVGRLPAATNSDVQNVIAKIMEYEQNPAMGNWRNSALFISGNDRGEKEKIGDPIGEVRYVFRAQNGRVLSTLLPNHVSAIRLNTVEDDSLTFDPNFGSRIDLERHFQDGLFLINFMGHGGGGIWADAEILDLDDVDNLRNKGMYPFVTSMTCFTGAFENPTKQGLAQKMVLAPERGAIGVLASSGLGYTYNDYAMLWNTGQLLFDKSYSLGEIIMLGKIFYYNNGDTYLVENGQGYPTLSFDDIRHEMIYQYNLLGDPFLHLNFSEENATIEASTLNPQPGDPLVLTVTAPISGAEGYVELADAKFNIVKSVPLFNFNQSETVQFDIPADFPQGSGLIRAYLNNTTDNAAAKLYIGVNHAAISDVAVSPESPNVDDTVFVSMKISDVHGVNSVKVGRLDSALVFNAVQDANDTTLFVAKIDPIGRLQNVPFEIKVENKIGNTSIFTNFGYVVTDIRPDIRPLVNSLAFSGNKKVRLKVAIENRAGAGADGEVKVNAFFSNGKADFLNNVFFASGSTILNASDSTSLTVDFPLPLDGSNYDIYVKTSVAPDEDVIDFNPNNNTTSSTLQPTLFNLVQTSASAPIDVANGVYTVTFPAGSVSDSSAVRVQLREFTPPEDQTGLVPVFLIDSLAYHALEVTLLNPSAEFIAPFSIKAKINPAFIDARFYQVTDASLYSRTVTTQPWISTLARANGVTNIIEANLRKSAWFAPFINRDFTAPAIELTADGRPLVASGLVSTAPSLYIVAQDESGVNLQTENITISLNGNPIPEEQIFVPDSVKQNNVLGVTIYPELAQGKHQLEVGVQDVNGNPSRKTFELVVADGFDVHVYGNYPNPFSDQTIFSYFVSLNDDLDLFEIRIYTVNGRFIRKLDSDINNGFDDPDGGARRKGYNELIWDGRDEQGNEVANGLYFAVIRATYEAETIEKILKVARLK